MPLTMALALLPVALMAATTAKPAAAKAVAAKTSSSATVQKKSLSQSAAEAMYAALPQESIRNAEGFFAPVVKKYTPTVEAFQRDYEAATDKMAVIERYMPKADAALAEAKAMKVPQKYEAEKASYIKTAERFLFGIRLMLMARKQ